MQTPDSETNIGLSPRVRWRAVGEEGVVVHLEQGRVLVLNAVGLFAVQRLSNPLSRQALAVAIADEFEVSSEQAEADMDAFLAQLDAEQVLERQAA